MFNVPPHITDCMGEYGRVNCPDIKTLLLFQVGKSLEQYELHAALGPNAVHFLAYYHHVLSIVLAVHCAYARAVMPSAKGLHLNTIPGLLVRIRMWWTLHFALRL